MVNRLGACQRHDIMSVNYKPEEDLLLCSLVLLTKILDHLWLYDVLVRSQSPETLINYLMFLTETEYLPVIVSLFIEPILNHGRLDCGIAVYLFQLSNIINIWYPQVVHLLFKVELLKFSPYFLHVFKRQSRVK